MSVNSPAEAEEFVSYISRVFQRTLRVVVMIPAEGLEHDFGTGRFTPGDTVRHLAAMNRYMFVEIAAGGTNRYPGHDRSHVDGLANVLAYHERLCGECLDILKAMPHTEFNAKRITPEGASITTWKWLRAMVEHEAHHRGQLYWMLAELGIKTPPLYGLTSEQVRERAAPSA